MMLQVTFAYAAGPLAWSVVAFRNSLVFHSLDKVRNLFACISTMHTLMATAMQHLCCISSCPANVVCMMSPSTFMQPPYHARPGPVLVFQIVCPSISMYACSADDIAVPALVSCVCGLDRKVASRYTCQGVQQEVCRGYD